MRRRHLSPDERALWEQVARSAEPMHRHPRAPLPAPPPQPAPRPASAPELRHDPPPPIPAFHIGERAGRGSAATPALALPAPRKPPRMDARTHGRMRKGRLTPDSRIDLHGMTLAQAHRALIGFVLSGRAAGHRLVLVITGKGRPREAGPLPPERGLLREQVPDWLTLPPLDALVLDVTTAHQSHGGEGALYVYLRRR